MINYKYYPSNERTPEFLLKLVSAFDAEAEIISSASNNLDSNSVLTIISHHLLSLGYQVESGKKKNDKIVVPVLFGLNGKVEKKFEADAYNPLYKIVLEVEAGRGYTNNQFLKDYFQACMMLDVDFFAVAIRNDYRKNKDFDKVKNFFDALYASNRVKTQLKGVIIIGY